MHRAALAVSAVLHTAAVVWAAVRLPARVPVHWSGGLSPDRWGSRTQFVTATALVGVGVAALLVGVAVLLRRIPVRWIDVPYADHWRDPRHEGELRRRLVQDALALCTATLLLLAVITLLAVDAATSPQQRLSGWTVVVVVGYLATVLGRVLWIATVRYRPADGAAPAVRR